jgi:hypothetical protein
MRENPGTYDIEPTQLNETTLPQIQGSGRQNSKRCSTAHRFPLNAQKSLLYLGKCADLIRSVASEKG